MLVGLLLLASAVARAADKPPPVTLDVATGWDGAFRAGEWTPVFVTVSAPSPRAIGIAVVAPHDNAWTMRVVQQASAGPQPTTFQILSPLPWDTGGVAVVVSDLQTGRTLADTRLADDDRARPPPRPVGEIDLFIAYAGASPAPAMRLGELRQSAVVLGSLDPARLPVVPIAYFGIDVLVLGQADLARIDPAAQQAIADWVYAGGKLLLWLAEGPVPPRGPLADLLPAEIGPPETISLDSPALASVGLPARFGRIGVRATLPRPGATEFDLLGPTVRGTTVERGRGGVALLPVNAGLLLFPGDRPDGEAAFWRAALAPLLGSSRLAPRVEGQPAAPVSWPQPNWARLAAMESALQFVGDVPGIGGFGFGWVVAIVAGLALVVGPIDWIILKRLGRQPWTIYTTLGWIALVTVGATGLGIMVYAGETHFRTLTLVDQFESRAIATTQVVGLYSPRTRRYQIETSPDAWWRPVSANPVFYSPGGQLRPDVAFRQTPRGNAPAPAAVPVWSLRFFRGDELTPRPPLLAGELTLVPPARLVGQIRNIGADPLGEFVIHTPFGAALLPPGESLAPGQSRAIDLPLAPLPEPQDHQAAQRYYARRGGGEALIETDPKSQYVDCFALLPGPVPNIGRQASARFSASVFASAEPAEPPAGLRLANPPADTRALHRLLLRAELPMNISEGTRSP